MTLSSFFSLVEKDLKILFRSKVSFVVIILMPLLIVLASGYGFSSSKLSGISIATYSESYSNISENILINFEEHEFSSMKYDSLDSCVNSVKSSKNQICIFFPKNLSYEDNDEEVVFYVDYSRTNLAYNLINLVNEEISSEASDFGVILVQNLIDNLNSVKTSLNEEKEQIDLILNEVDEVNDLGEGLETGLKSPVEELTALILELEDYENASEIQTEIDDLKEIQKKISDNLEDTEDINFINGELQTDFYLLSESLDDLIKKLNTLEIGAAENIVTPFNINVESINSSENKREYLIPTIISLISLFGGILISSTLVLKNKKTCAYFRNFVTPTKDITFIFSTYLTSLIILFLQFLLVFLGLYFAFQMNFFKLPLENLSILFLGWSVFIFIGMFLGYLFKSEETILFSSVLFSAVLMFFSNIILPLENISGNLLKIVSFNPLVLLENSLKKVYLFELSFKFIWVELLFLGIFLLLFLILSSIMRNLNKRVL